MVSIPGKSRTDHLAHAARAGDDRTIKNPEITGTLWYRNMAIQFEGLDEVDNEVYVLLEEGGKIGSIKVRLDLCTIMDVFVEEGLRREARGNALASFMSLKVLCDTMKFSDGRVAGALFFVAASQFVLGLVVAEALYPGYSVSANYISDLGVGPSAMYFNSSVFLMGLLLIIGAYFLQRAFDYKALTVLLVLTAIGAMGVGVFTEHFGIIHDVVSLIAFLFGGLSAIFSAISSYIHKFKLLKMPFSIIALILGLMCLGAMALFEANVNLGLGVGGMERMIVYPLLMWGAGFGGYLIASPEKGTVK